MTTNSDILLALYEGRISLDEAYRKYDKIMATAGFKGVADAFGLTKRECSAFAFGAGLDDLARWRYQGWPDSCFYCGQPIGETGWFVVEVRDTVHLCHIACMPSKDSS